jgi:hypothetical protein
MLFFPNYLKVPQIEYSIAQVGYKVERIDNKEWSDQVLITLLHLSSFSQIRVLKKTPLSIPRSTYINMNSTQSVTTTQSITDST